MSGMSGSFKEAYVLKACIGEVCPTISLISRSWKCWRENVLIGGVKKDLLKQYECSDCQR